MSKIDIRNNNVGPVTEIVFADVDSTNYYADSLVKRNSGGFEIRENDTNKLVLIRDRQHFDNLLKALNKAHYYGWV